MKKFTLGLGGLSILSATSINIVSCAEISMSKEVQKELGYLNSNYNPNIEAELKITNDHAFEVKGYKLIKDHISNTDVKLFVNKQLKINDNYDKINEKLEKIEFDEINISADKIALKSGTVIANFYKNEKTNVHYGKKRFNLKDLTIKANEIETILFPLIKANDIEIEPITKIGSEKILKGKFAEKCSKALQDFIKVTNKKVEFIFKFVSATDENGVAKTDNLSKNDKVTVEVSIKNLTNASITIQNVDVA